MSQAPPMFRAVATELESAGAVPGRDFFVHYVNSGDASSEFYGLRLEEDRWFVVYYSDMGHVRELLRTDDPDAAKRLFRARVLSIAEQRVGH